MTRATEYHFGNNLNNPYWNLHGLNDNNNDDTDKSRQIETLHYPYKSQYHEGFGARDTYQSWTRHSRNRTISMIVLLVSLILAISTLLCLSFPSYPSKIIHTYHEQQSISSSGVVVDNITEQRRPAKSLQTNNLTDEVAWDGYSMILRGQRVFLYSGEFHTFRLPVPSLWPDILQKFAAAGLNSVSLYTHWGLLQPSPSEGVDLGSFRALAPFYQACVDAGLWVVLRPGPYINAETTAGGIAHWATSEVGENLYDADGNIVDLVNRDVREGKLRSNGSEWQESWKVYVREVMEESKRWQITEGGPIIAVQIDNEYDETEYGARDYFQAVEDEIRASGIVVPLTYNDPNQGKNFVNGTGSADIYGLDAYPQRFDCSHPEHWNPVVANYHDYHMDTNPGQPFYSPEFQAGAFDAWGPSAPGYSNCQKLTGAQFESVFYKSLWAANAKWVNFYMGYGGTSWGAIPFPGVYTSYDYGSAISENRELAGAKYDELKLQGMFLRSSPAFYKTDMVGNSSESNGVVKVHHLKGTGKAKDEGTAFVVKLQNPESRAGFWIARQTDSTDEKLTRFKLDINPASVSSALTTHTTLTIPQIVPAISLHGRQSKVLLTDYTFGKSSKVLYSSAEVMYAGVIGDRDVLVVYGDTKEEVEQGGGKEDGEGSEMALWLKGYNAAEGLETKHAGVVFREGVENIPEGANVEGSDSKLVTVAFLGGIEGLITVFDSEEQLVMYADRKTAGKIWSPTIPADSAQLPTSDSPFSHFFQFGTNSSILVTGPYLVRSATITSDGILKLKGDLKEDVTMLGIIGPRGLRGVEWNGMRVEDFRDTKDGMYMVANGQVEVTSIERGGFLGVLRKRRPVSLFPDTTTTNTVEIDAPKLENWNYFDSLPEVTLGRMYDDDRWIEANKTVTKIPDGVLYHDGSGKVLFGCDYGFCENIVLWRGHFVPTSETKTVKLAINGGEAFAASVFVNGEFLGTTYGNSTNNNNIVREMDQSFAFPQGSLVEGEDNVITVVQDNMGLEETEGDDMGGPDASRSPRGIRGYQLNSGNFTSWKVQGKVGGYTNFPDKHRGIFNEGGLHAERLGAHLPGFTTVHWRPRDLSAGLPGNKAGVGFFVTSFEMDVPEGFDVMLSFEFADTTGWDGQPYRALLFVNGWMMGKRVANLGPQAKFPVHEGILDYHGTNTVAVALWAMESVPVTPKLSVKIDAIIDGGMGNIIADNPPWSPKGRQNRYLPVIR